MLTAPEGFIVNHKRLFRIYREERLRPPRRRTMSRTRSRRYPKRRRSWARALSRSRNSVSGDLREQYRTVIRTQPIILHGRRSLNSNAEHT
jgi:hypothetical protein